MNHEIVGPEMTITTGQLRLPKAEAIARHIAQYGTRSDLEREARRLTIQPIVAKLGIEESEVPFHDRDEVNLTLMMIWDKRQDLAKQLWTDPETFKKDRPALFELGVKRVDVEIRKRGGHDWSTDAQTIRDWKQTLGEIEETE